MQKILFTQTIRSQPNYGTLLATIWILFQDLNIRQGFENQICVSTIQIPPEYQTLTAFQTLIPVENCTRT